MQRLCRGPRSGACGSRPTCAWRATGRPARRILCNTMHINNMYVRLGGPTHGVGAVAGVNAGQSPSQDVSPIYIDGADFYFRDNSTGTTAQKVVKLDMSDVNPANVTNLMPNTAIPSNVLRHNIFVSITAPNSTQTANRAYTKAPSLKVRVSGILSDQ